MVGEGRSALGEACISWMKTFCDWMHLVDFICFAWVKTLFGGLCIVEFLCTVWISFEVLYTFFLCIYWSIADQASMRFHRGRPSSMGGPLWYVPVFVLGVHRTVRSQHGDRAVTKDSGLVLTIGRTNAWSHDCCNSLWLAVTVISHCTAHPCTLSPLEWGKRYFTWY